MKIQDKIYNSLVNNWTSIEMEFLYPLIPRLLDAINGARIAGVNRGKEMRDEQQREKEDHDERITEAGLREGF